ncbi:MAG: hypothetical protein A2521_17455 [Deltaproteobacteria bacterium RIFOXYD12_FULL_57_12]|nr:MAG: hypothetical protein A2521_17455 [Deltaproteobacteria bacterium RIFOXYD12_FULL_57_12]
MRVKQKRFLQGVLLTITAILSGANIVLAEGNIFDQNWNDREIQQRIEMGIKTNRMGFATLSFVDQNGRPVSEVEVKVEQTRSDFLFGANIFYLNGYDSPEMNRKYEEMFTRLFNFATVGFYWNWVEPKPGDLRYDRNSPFIVRKPAPDVVVDFCRKNQLEMRGHPLCWVPSQPDWLPRDKEKLASLQRKRFQEIGARYARKIKYWDVVNEPTNRHVDAVLPDDCTCWALQLTDKYFTPENALSVNTTTIDSWLNFYWEDSPFYLLVKNLQLRGARLDFIGMQFHIDGHAFAEDFYAGKVLTPEHLSRVLDQYGKLGLPIHISEITLPTPRTPDGEEMQAKAARHLYRLWFSHPNVQAITWWNLGDDHATMFYECKGALMRPGLVPKPSYVALDRLINHEWKTRLVLTSEKESKIKFQGFYGSYTITARHKGKIQTETIHLSKTGFNEFEIRFR